MGDERAQHFVVLNETMKIDFIGVIGIETTLTRILESGVDDSDDSDEDADSSAAKSSTVTRWVGECVGRASDCMGEPLRLLRTR